MSGQPDSISPRPALPISSPLATAAQEARLTEAVYLDGRGRMLFVTAAVLFLTLVALLDCQSQSRFSIYLLYFLPVAACAWSCGFSYGILMAVAGTVAWYEIDLVRGPTSFLPVAVCNGILRFGMLAFTSSLLSRLHASILRERLLARTDPLTGAANGRTFYEDAEAEVERARRQVRPLTLAYLDLDNFKLLNDQLGHAAGDAALVRLAQTLRINLRRADLLARLGGDEFALLLPETDFKGAVTLLNRLHERVSQDMVLAGWPVTLSIGAITFDLPLDLDKMIQQADALMYRAKSKGKGRVEYAAVTHGQDCQVQDRRRVERRATTRVLCRQTVRVRPGESLESWQGLATICDISARGVGMQQENPFPTGTLLIIEPLFLGGKALLARVVNLHQVRGGWRHGCELATQLNDEELRSWCHGNLEKSSGPGGNDQ